ncbi:MAG: hypothetical protein ABWY13_03505 [Mesorhizobium sp.]|uniref:hypothetical protein n=1 Tax=Devosia sp. TaxID=1871048 RepID=UPI0033973776
MPENLSFDGNISASDRKVRRGFRINPMRKQGLEQFQEKWEPVFRPEFRTDGSYF